MNPPYPSDITAFEPPLPLGISNGLPWGGVWIFSGTTHSSHRWGRLKRVGQTTLRGPGAVSEVLENCRRAFSPDPTDCSWVSEDGARLAFIRFIRAVTAGVAACPPWGLFLLLPLTSFMCCLRKKQECIIRFKNLR